MTPEKYKEIEKKFIPYDVIYEGLKNGVYVFRDGEVVHRKVVSMDLDAFKIVEYGLNTYCWFDEYKSTWSIKREDLE